MENKFHLDLENSSVSKKTLFGIIGILCIIIIMLVASVCLLLKNISKETGLQQNSNQQLKDSIGSVMGDETVNSKDAVGKMNPQSSDLSMGEKKDKPERKDTVNEDTMEEVYCTKEYILSEALPYFEDNNLEAVWDLAHLKRYVKLSSEISENEQFYYIGDMDQNGIPNGKGLAMYPGNIYYYGDWKQGQFHGTGRYIHYFIGSDKEKNKKYYEHSYAGGFENGLPSGEGAEHFEIDRTQLKADERVIQNVVGQFSEGMYDGELFANTLSGMGIVEEWYGSANKGTMNLFRDKSSIGECSVWQNKDDKNLYIDIFEKENKNLGIKELLDIANVTK